MYKIVSLLLIVILLTSCSNSFQYDVYVINETGQAIRIDYRTNNGKNGVEENSVTLNDGDRHFLISTKEIAKYEELDMKNRDYCSKVATYIGAFTESGELINKNWCDDDLEIESVDIGQAEYSITYTKGDL